MIVENRENFSLSGTIFPTPKAKSSPNDGHLSYLRVWNSSGMDYYKYGIFALVIAFSCLGNLLIVLTISLTKQLQKVTNYFLANMAVSYLLVAVVCMPIHLMTWFDQSVMLNRLTCKVVPFLQGTSVCATVYTLIVIAIDRYKVILYPFNDNIHKNHCFLVIAFIWLSAVITVSPSLFVYEVQFDELANVTRCDEYGWSDQSKMEFTYTLLVVTYILPFLIFTIIYGKLFAYLWFREIPGIKAMPKSTQKCIIKKRKCRRKLIQMLFTIVISFLICHLPQNIINFLWYYGQVVGWQAPPYMGIVSFHAEILLYLNAVINPIIYAYVNPYIRRSALSLLSCWPICRQRNSYQYYYSK